MEVKHLIVPILLLGCLPVQARDYVQSGGTQQTSCYENVYREEYVPGTKNNPGYVRRFSERVEVPCEGPQVSTQPAPYQPVDDNSCVEGSVIGGIAGAAAGAALSRDEGMFIGIPLGIVGGALVGCQIDGG